MLDPHFVVDDVYVQNASVHAVVALPSDVHDQIMLVTRIHDRFGVHLTVKGAVLDQLHDKRM